MPLHTVIQHDLRRLRDYLVLIRDLCQQYGPRGPVALVAGPNAIGSANRFALHRAHEGRDTQVFWDRDEANDWLALG